MSPLNKTGLRLAAAGAAAALTLAAGAPAFAQTTPEADEETTSPVDKETIAPSPGGDATTTPADENSTSPDGDETTTPADEDPTSPGEGGMDEEEDYYEFAYLDHLVEDANVGDTVTASPQIQVSGSPMSERVGTLIWFTDTVDMDAWYEGDWFDFSEVATGHATVLDEYDNCSKVVVGHLACIVTDWNPEDGKTYAPSAGSPVNYLVEGEVDDQDISAYSAFDIVEEDLEYYTDWLEVDLDGSENFSLTEVDPADVGDEEYFIAGEGWIMFMAGVEDAPHPNLPGNDGEPLPKTGNSSTVLISSAAAALLAGAVLFFLMRRRKAEASWE